MQAVRIELPQNGIGIFWNDWYEEGLGLKDMSEMYSTPGTILWGLRIRHQKEVPTPHRNEGLGNIRFSEKCAFSSVEQLKRLITPEEMGVLVHFGFHVYLLELREGHYRVGAHQILYEEAGIETKTDITDLFETVPFKVM